MTTALKWLGGGVLVLILLVVGTYLALRRPDIPFDTLEAKYANSASRFVDLPGGLHVHYRDQGNRTGPVLVLVHGFSASLHTWEPWVAQLGDRYRIITLDLPGHGLTRAPVTYQPSAAAFADVVDQTTAKLGVKTFVLGGNSMGGSVAWTFALRHPDRLKGLVLVDAAGWAHDQAGAKTPLVFKLLRYPLGRAVLRDIDTRPLITQGLRAGFGDPSLVDGAMIDRYVELGRATGHRDILLTMQTNRSPSAAATPAKLAQIRVPTLVMHGQADVIIPPADGQAFAQAIPGSVLILYPKVGHVPMEEVAAKSAADLDGWLQDKGLGATPPAL
jgi:pimeloyl-ACP methyl ester carboxylesterase